MPRWLALLLLVALLPWQSVAWAADAARDRDQGGESHVIAHWIGEAHHHHDDDDGDAHHDESEDSWRHLHADMLLNAPSALPSTSIWTAAALPASAPAAARSDLRPAPCLEGPRRPPRIFG